MPDAGAAPAQQPAPEPKKYCASIYPGPDVEVDKNLAGLVKKLEIILEIPIWLLIQDGGGEFGSIDDDVLQGFKKQCGEIAEKKPVGLLIESPGGNAHYAYQIARLFQRRASQFTVIVPQYAKSAATLMALGASDLMMGRDAELGPLDVQMYDPEREEFGSALNAVQSLERLNAFSMAAIDQLMPLLIRRTGRKVDRILPEVLKYVVSFVEPLLQKIDAVDYTMKSRELKVAEEYARRLMKRNYRWSKATTVASSLVEKFPTHGFVIDRDEATAFEINPEEGMQFGLGLNIKTPQPEVDEILTSLTPILDDLTIIGQLKEMK